MAYLIIDRSKISPEWDAATKLLYLWLCEEAAFSPHEWRGVKVEGGQYLTTLRELAEVFKCDQHTILRRLKKLETFQSVNIKSIRAKSGKLGCQALTLITIQRQILSAPNNAPNNAPNAHQINTSDTSSYNPSKIESAPNSAPNNAATITEYNITEIKDTEIPPPPPHASARTHEGEAVADEICRELIETIRTDQASQYNIQSKSGISPYAAISYARDFANEVEMRGDKGKRGRQLVLHFIAWLQIRLRYEARAAAEDKRNKQISSNGDPRQAAKDTAEAIRRDFFAKYGGAQPHSGISPTAGHLPDPRGIR